MRERDPLRLVGVEELVGATALDHRCELPGEIDCIAEARVESLSADGAVDVRGVAEKKRPAGAKARGDPVMDVIGGKPVDLGDLDAQALQNDRAHVGPLQRSAALRRRVLDGSDQPRVAVALHRERGEEAGIVERDMQLVIHHRARPTTSAT